MRESKRKLREPAAKESIAPPPETDVNDGVDELTRLRRQVDELQKEKATLRKELAALRAALT